MKLKAANLSMYAHQQHDVNNFHRAVAVARRCAADPRATDIHVATAYLQSIGTTARITPADMVLAGIPAAVVRAVVKLEPLDNELFLDYLIRVADHPDTALVAHHDFLERLTNIEVLNDDDIVRRFRRAAAQLNEAVNMGVPRVG